MRIVRYMAPLVAALALLAPTSRADDKESGKRLFWHVTSEKGEIWLLGSIHVADESFYPLPKEIEQAYKKSNALAVEADIAKGDPAKLQELVMSKGMYEEEGAL